MDGIKLTLFRLATSVSMWIFLIVVAVSAVLAITGDLDSSSFVQVFLAVGTVAVGYNKISDAADPKEYESFKAFLADLPSRGNIIFIIGFPVFCILLHLKVMDGTGFLGAVTGVIAIALGSRGIGEIITAKKNGSSPGAADGK